MIVYDYLEPVAYPMWYFANASSIFTSLFLTIERYLAICRHISFSLIKTKMISFSIILICAILTSGMWVSLIWKSEKFSSGNYTIAVPSEIAMSSHFRIYWTALVIFLFVIPLILFLVFNVLIIKEVSKTNFIDEVEINGFCCVTHHNIFVLRLPNKNISMSPKPQVRLLMCMPP